MGALAPVPPDAKLPSGNGLAQLDDGALITVCLENAQESDLAWEEVVRRFRRKVFGIAYKFTGRYEEAQDLTQEIFFAFFARSRSSIGARISAHGCTL